MTSHNRHHANHGWAEQQRFKANSPGTDVGLIDIAAQTGDYHHR
jgi:hypothetical protein